MREVTENIAKARKSFRNFVYLIFSQSFDQFYGGDYIDEVCRFYEFNKDTARISARDHFKSTGLYAVIMHDIFFWEGDLEMHYFSFQEGMAGYHIGKLKNLIARNPYFVDIIDLKPKSESTMLYNRDGYRFSLEPHGMLAFKRGIHAERIYVDDPFQDPENKLVPTVIKKINDVFVTQILDMPKKGGRLHVVGTPQTNHDFFFQKNVMQNFSIMIKPAVVSYKKRQALWPEHMDFDTLMQKKAERGPKIFNQEFMCSPVYSENSYFTEKQIDNVTDESLPNLTLNDTLTGRYDVVAGHDIGKKAHPAHFVVYEIIEGKPYQRHSKWMDGWDYSRGKNPDGSIKEFDPNHPSQIEYINACIEAFQIDTVFYDDTRGEFEALSEQGALPKQMEPIKLTAKEKFSLAANMERFITSRNIALIDDPRQAEQITMVTNDLQAVETPQGHGDSFWSNALALRGISMLAGHLKQFYDNEGFDVDEEEDDSPLTAGLATQKF